LAPGARFERARSPKQ